MRKYLIAVLICLTAILLFNIRSILAWDIATPPISGGTFTTVNNYGQLAVGASGFVYVTGVGISGHDVAKYDANGNFVMSFGPSGSPGVTVDSDGNILVTNWNSQVGVNPGVYKFDSSGTPIDISGTDLGASTFIFSFGIASDSLGNVYVSDIQGNGDSDMVRKYDSTGTLVATITGNGTPFNQPQAVAVDGSDNLYVLDSGNNRVQKFNSAGTFVLEITDGVQAMSYPEGFTVDTSGNLYISDSGNNKVKIFNTAGVLQQSLVPADFGLGAFNYLVGQAITTDGILYSGDSNKILKATFDRTPASLSVNSLPSDTSSSATPSFTGTATDSQSTITSVEYAVDASAYSACVADDGAFDELSEAYTCTVSPALSEGSHTLSVRSTDSKGNTNTGLTLFDYGFTVNTVVPTATPTPTSAVTPTPTPTATPTSVPQNNSNNNNSNSSQGSNSAPSCSDSPTLFTPDLFEIRTTKNTAKLQFTPLPDTNKYYISFSVKPSAEENGEEVVLTREGIQSHTVYQLKPYTFYYFKVRGHNGCMPGKWSNIVKVRTSSQVFYKNSLPISNLSSSRTTKTIIPAKNKAKDRIIPSNSTTTETQIILPPSVAITDAPQPTQVTNIAPVQKNSEAPASAPVEKPKRCFLWWCF
ncbi:MAG: fibronectin type III domain-containing protein [Candidatus Shapirobacteria bacterium]|jgi:hypothetical protein